MTQIGREIFKAIHTGKWLNIEYCNQAQERKRYWVNVKGIDIKSKKLIVDGLRLSDMNQGELTIFADSILNASAIEESYADVNQDLVNDITYNPTKYDFLFQETLNLKILDYLELCNRLDNTPYKTDYTLIDGIDESAFLNNEQTGYPLSSVQFEEIVKKFQRKAEKNATEYKIKQLTLNILSVNTQKGLYVLAYKRLYLDVNKRCLKADSEVTVNKEFTIDGEKFSVRRFLDEADYGLLENFSDHAEEIKDIIMKQSRLQVDDIPHFIALGFDVVLDLKKEYNAIAQMFYQKNLSYPLHAFFGDIKERPRRTKDYPIVLPDQKSDKKPNIDQLLTIHNALKYPVTYVQGPPGTGKTSTIINAVITAFFNEKTVLCCSYNNRPVNGIFDKLKNLTHNGKRILFPIVRLGNEDMVKEAIKYIKDLYEYVKPFTVYESSLQKKHNIQEEKMQKLTSLLKNYEEMLWLRERKETIQDILQRNQSNLKLTADLQMKQLEKLNRRLAEIGEISDEDATDLLDADVDELMKYLHFTTVKLIKKLDEPKYKPLTDILFMKDENKRLTEFNKYLSTSDNFEKFLKVFPIVATTNISANRLGEPTDYFDMVIMDEASQCNSALALVPILRGKNLMLVGDPQQLNPVILMTRNDNEKLMRKYNISPEYNYCENSVYKTFLSADSISDEILLSYHYRSHPDIINFNNKKYYNSKLKIKSDVSSPRPLEFIDVSGSRCSERNTSLGDAEEIIRYIKSNGNAEIGIITPFVKQKNLIQSKLDQEGYSNITCGTIHTFQGDEKDIVIFSAGITSETEGSTYNWLKNNKELINVATSRPRQKLVMIADAESVKKLNADAKDDDFFELCEYIKKSGQTTVRSKEAKSRALGIKPYSTETEEAFFQSLNHVIGATALAGRYNVKKEVAISTVFDGSVAYNDLFFKGRFDFVVFQWQGKKEMPVLAIELDGPEHKESDIVKKRDAQKNELCKKHRFELLRVENSYARRYNHIKKILIDLFNG